LRAGQRHAAGQLALDDDTFKEMSRLHPELAPLCELRHSLSQLRLADLAVGTDGRNRTLLSPFGSKTGRNQPSNAKYIFGPSVWLRGLIRPSEGMAIAYIDYSQQEFAIAAALSGDKAMMDAYVSGDPYLAFAQRAGAAPADATKQTHGAVRERFKVCALAVLCDMGAASLSLRIGMPESFGRELLELHHRTYPTYWKWSDRADDYAVLVGRLQTTFGWTLHRATEPNYRSLRDFLIQGNGAEMLRLACCLAIERGITVCGPIHAALIIEAPIAAIEHAVAVTQEAMAEASAIVLNGVGLRSDAKGVRGPERYMDPRGARIRNTARDAIGLDPDTMGVRPRTPDPCTSATNPLRERTPAQSHACCG